MTGYFINMWRLLPPHPYHILWQKAVVQRSPEEYRSALLPRNFPPGPPARRGEAFLTPEGWSAPKAATSRNSSDKGPSMVRELALASLLACAPVAAHQASAACATVAPTSAKQAAL